jgi:adenylate cyclase
MWKWKRIGKFGRRQIGIWLTAPSIAAVVIGLRIGGLLQSWEWAAYDRYMYWQPIETNVREELPNEHRSRVAIVGIGERDIQRLGQPILSDRTYAKVLRRLKAQNPRAIGLDIYRDVRVPPGRQELTQVFQNTDNLIGIQKVIGDSQTEAVAPPPILKEKGQVGANDLIVDADDRVRRGLLYLRDDEGNRKLSLALHLAFLYLQEENIQPETIPGTNKWKLGKQVFHPLQPNDGGYVRADTGGYQVLIKYRGSTEFFDTVSLTDVLEGRIPSDWATDRIVLIGRVGESFQDAFFTPISSGFLTLSKRMSGVEIHANMTSQIVSAALDDRRLIETWSEPVEWLWILLWSGLGATLAWTGRWSYQRSWTPWVRVAGSLLAVSLLLGVTYGAFVAGWWIPVVPPLLAFVGSGVAITVYMAHWAKEIRKTFGRYLSDEVVATLLENPEKRKLGGERRRVTILTSDLRGFTLLSERLSPEQVIQVLNFYLSYMADVIYQYQGTIDEFIGDGILVVFGTPTPHNDDAERAIACAIHMQLAMEQVNKQMQAWGLPNLEMGIGVNTGEVVVGNIGSEKRTKYGIVGSQVNVAFRIESYTVGGQILISEATWQEVADTVKVRRMEEVHLKGVQTPVMVYEVSSIQGKYNLSLTTTYEKLYWIREAIPLQYFILDGKHVSDSCYWGNLIKLSAKEAEIAVDSNFQACIPPPLENIKINFFFANDGETPRYDVYAKVLACNTHFVGEAKKTPRFHIRFTAQPQEIHTKLMALYQSVRED